MTAQPLNRNGKKSWQYWPDGMTIYAIKDFMEVEHLFHPQIQEEGRALHPDCSFLFAKSDNCFFVIHVAMDIDGFYHYGYTLDEPERGGGCFPSKHWKDHKKAATLKSCLLNALNMIKGMSMYYGHTPYPLYVRTATEAIKIVNESGVKQLSLFDF